MIDFLSDNLARSAFSPRELERVSSSVLSGQEEETLDGWPYLRWGVGAHALDAPLSFSVFEHVGAERGTKVILFGLGLGHSARALRGAGARLAFIFEPEPAVVRHYFERGPSDLEGVRIITSLSDVVDEWSRLVGDSERVHFVDTPGYAQAFPEARTALTTRITQALERRLVNDIALRSRGRTWVRHVVHNIEALAVAPSALALQGEYRGVPAFIVGAGPSLAKNIELLVEARTKGLIFAVNSSAQALEQAGVAPQVLGCLESIDVSSQLADLQLMDSAARVVSLTAHPCIFRKGRGPLLPVYELVPQISRPLEGLLQYPALPVSGSVSTALVALAHRLGCSPIVLLGQDLAYTDGRAYAVGTAYENSRVSLSGDQETVSFDWCETMNTTKRMAGAEPLRQERATQVRAWGGVGYVSSTPVFGQIRTWFERVAELLERTSERPRLINATEGGSHIAGFEDLAFAEVLIHLEERRIEPEDLERRARSKQSTLPFSCLRTFILEQAAAAHAVAEAAQLVVQLSEQLANDWEKDGPSRATEALAALGKAERQLKLMMAGAPWVDAWGWQAIDELGTSSLNSSGVLEGVIREQAFGAAVAIAATELAELLEARAQEFTFETSV